MNALMKLEYNGTPVRTFGTADDPRFVVRDVCDILELKDTNKALLGLDEEDLTGTIVVSGGQRRQMKLVNESGLYQLIFKSRKEGAKRFKRWVTREVLPQLRKTGRYSVQNALQVPAPSKTQEGMRLVGDNEYINLLKETIGLQRKVIELGERLKPARLVTQKEHAEYNCMHRQGLSISEISRQTGRTRTTCIRLSGVASDNLDALVGILLTSTGDKNMKHARKDYDIPENEPVFLVRAQDPLAAETMRYWAWLHRRRLKDHNRPDDGMADLVEGHADLSDEWQPKKMFADM